MKTLAAGLAGVDGFLALGKHVGIKRQAKDFAVLYSESACQAAAVYTRNQVKGAPLYVTEEHLKDHQARAIAVNSGIANVATGEQGIKNARKTAETVAAELGLRPADVLLASTGVIGPQLPMAKIIAGAKGIKRELTRGGDFAGAIMTTDTVKKEICIEHENFRIAAAAKGSGMISPNMATMLAFIITDADIAAAELSPMLKRSVNKSFNMVSVDMDTSTSDMVIIMANGRAKDVDRESFQQVLDHVCVELAKMIARDGEGATKLIIAEAKGAAGEADARKAARAIVTSNLIKCAVYGNDPNWGRLMMAIGNSGADNLDVDQIKIGINGRPVVEKGRAADGYDEKQLSKTLKDNQKITITVDMGVGTAAATAYGCDMSEDYVKINAEYTT